MKHTYVRHLASRLQPGFPRLPPALAGGGWAANTLIAEPALAGLPGSANRARAKARDSEARLKPADKGKLTWNRNHQLKLVADSESRLKPAPCNRKPSRTMCVEQRGRNDRVLRGRAADHSPERASFHSPGRNPGSRCGDTTVALQGRHSHDAPIGVPRGARRGSWADMCVRAAEHSGDWRRSGECRPVGAYNSFCYANPGFRCAAPWAIEYDPLGVGGLRPHSKHRRAARLLSPERASFDSPGCNPGSSPRDANVALKGRYSVCVVVAGLRGLAL
jgi:hypothetical protein